MPGVPSSKACDGCRKQRKRCDQEKPACSRCRKLNIICTGAGQQRWLFKEEAGTSRKGNTKLQSPSSGTSLRGSSSAITVLEVPRTPSSHLTVLASSLLNAIKPTTSIRYNLVWTYGMFLEFVPQRLGLNAALDDAVDTLVTAHASVCLQRETSSGTLAKYCRALKTLRQCIEDPVKACSAETLCAVMILLTCQSFIGIKGKSSAHYEGAAQILKVRKFYNPDDEFESALLLTLRGPVLFGAILYPNISFTPSEWQQLIVNNLDGETYEGKIMHCLARLPELMERSRQFRARGIVDPETTDIAKANYQTIKLFMKGVQSNVAYYNSLPTGSEFDEDMRIQALLQRAHTLCLTVAIMLNINLRALKSPSDIESIKELEAETRDFTTEILEQGAAAARYRPLGGSYMSAAFTTAWIGLGEDDYLVRMQVEESLNDYLDDFPRDRSISYLERLRTLSRDVLGYSSGLPVS